MLLVRKFCPKCPKMKRKYLDWFRDVAIANSLETNGYLFRTPLLEGIPMESLGIPPGRCAHTLQNKNTFSILHFCHYLIFCLAFTLIVYRIYVYMQNFKKICLVEVGQNWITFYPDKPRDKQTQLNKSIQKRGIDCWDIFRNCNPPASFGNKCFRC